LARLNLTGGSIHNIVLNAAFMAAANRENTLITLETLFEAARAEFRKLEQPINEADFTLPERILKLETKGAVST
jgi:hypothetical protein